MADLQRRLRRAAETISWERSFIVRGAGPVNVAFDHVGSKVELYEWFFRVGPECSPDPRTLVDATATLEIGNKVAGQAPLPSLVRAPEDEIRYTMVGVQARDTGIAQAVPGLFARPADLWVCQRFNVEVNAPGAALDLRLVLRGLAVVDRG